jgi:hypothetical protein
VASLVFGVFFCNFESYWNFKGYFMQWSKLKKRVEDMFSPAVKGRVELRLTNYRATHDSEGRGYITFDKNEIWNMCTISYYPLEYEKINEFLEQDCDSISEAQMRAHQQLAKNGVLNQHTYYESLEDYCNNSIDKSINSENILIRSLAMLDSRMGKRRLNNFDVSGQPEKVTEFYQIRCKCEGLKKIST